MAVNLRKIWVPERCRCVREAAEDSSALEIEHRGGVAGVHLQPRYLTRGGVYDLPGVVCGGKGRRNSGTTADRAAVAGPGAPTGPAPDSAQYGLGRPGQDPSLRLSLQHIKKAQKRVSFVAKENTASLQRKTQSNKTTVF